MEIENNANNPIDQLHQTLTDYMNGNATKLDVYDQADAAQDAAQVAVLAFMHVEIPEFSNESVGEN